MSPDVFGIPYAVLYPVSFRSALTCFNLLRVMCGLGPRVVWFTRIMSILLSVAALFSVASTGGPLPYGWIRVMAVVM